MEDSYDGVFAAWYGGIGADGSRTTGYAVYGPRPRASKDDRVAKRLSLYEFLDTDRYGNLEAALTLTSPTSVFVADGVVPDVEAAKVEAALSAADVPATRAPKSAFAETGVVQALEKLAGLPVPHVEGLHAALRAAACLVSRGNLLSDPSNHGAVEVVAAGLDAHVRLDAAAVRALNLFPSARDSLAVPLAVSDPGAVGLDGPAGAGAGSGSGGSGGVSKAAGRAVTSVHQVLGYGCKTRVGKRTLRTWLLQPLTDIAAIRRRQDLVAAFVESGTLRRGWSEGVAVPDLEAIASRLAKAKAGLPDMVRLYAFATALPSIVERLRAYDGPSEYGSVLKDTYVDPLNLLAEDFGAFRGLVEAVVEDPTAADHPRVKRSWKDSLRELGEAKDELEAQCEETFDKLVRCVPLREAD
jgi:DNA mismatch repair protein MSH2